MSLLSEWAWIPVTERLCSPLEGVECLLLLSLLSSGTRSSRVDAAAAAAAALFAEEEEVDACAIPSKLSRTCNHFAAQSADMSTSELLGLICPT